MTLESKIKVRVQPNSSKISIIVDEDESIKIYLNSPPVDGKANSECIKILSKKLKIPKSQIEIIKGHKNREKTLIIHGLIYKQIIDTLKGC